MKTGYTCAILNANIRQQIAEGVPARIAIARALDQARRDFKAKYPDGFYPYHLRTVEQKARTNRHYQSNPVKALTWEQAFRLWKQYKTHLPEYKEFARSHGYSEGDLNARFATENGREKNPVPASSRSRSAQIEQAADLYQRFSGHDAEEVGTLDKPVIPDVLIGIGEIDGIMYSTVRDGVLEKYIHHFKSKSRPLFAVSPDGKQLFMLGGAYDFTERGIVDKT